MIRTLIAAVENAGAIEVEAPADPKIGLGHDLPRRELSEDDIAMILERERTEVSEALARYRELGLTEETKELDIRLRVIDRYQTH